jgi:hypothetical protein
LGLILFIATVWAVAIMGVLLLYLLPLVVGIFIAIYVAQWIWLLKRSADKLRDHRSN